MNERKQVSLGDLAIEFKVHKSRLSYYYKVGLIKPVSKVGKMHIFDYKETCDRLKKITSLQQESESNPIGKSLKEIKNILK